MGEFRLYGDTILPVAMSLLHKCRDHLVGSGHKTYDEALALTWNDIFDFSPILLYGAETRGDDQIIHLSDGRSFSLRALFERMNTGQLRQL